MDSYGTALGTEKSTLKFKDGNLARVKFQRTELILCMRVATGYAHISFDGISQIRSFDAKKSNLPILLTYVESYVWITGFHTS